MRSTQTKVKQLEMNIKKKNYKLRNKIKLKYLNK